MSLRNKIILTLLLIFTIYMVTSYLILNHTLYPAFKRLEQNAAADNLKRVQRSLALDLQHIADIATDWGYWDDAYEFVANKNQRFIESNLAKAYITELGFNLILFFDNNGELIWNEFYNRLQDQLSTPLDQLFPESLTLTNPLLQPQSPADALAGIIPTPFGPMLVVSVAVLPTSKQGSRRGVLILGSLLDEQRIATWSEQTRAAIELLPAEVSALPVPYLTAFDRLTGSRADVVFLEDELTQHAVALIRDISEQPLQVMSVALPRAITRLGEETIRLSLLMLLLAGSLIMLVTWLLLRKLMLAPVVRLTRHIQSLKNNSLSTDHLDTEERLQHAAQVLALKPFGPPDLQRRDEIGQLARAFEHMQENLLRSGRQIWRLAYQDSLTGLPNRRMFMELMRRALTGSHPGRHGFALLFLDLDNFKQINDTLGHDAGDELLQKVAGQLQSCVRHDNPDDHQDPAFRKDTIARLGGDEFVVLLSCIHGHEQATVVARRILDALAEPLVLQQQIVTIGVSIGITLCPIDGTDIDQLFKNADHAMYQAKQQGKNTYVHFTGNDADKIIAATADPVPPV